MYARNEINTHLALGRLDGAIRLARGNGVTLTKQLEVMDERLHAFFHGCAWRGDEFVVVNFDCAKGYFV